jgi:hypothetical protein
VAGSGDLSRLGWIRALNAGLCASGRVGGADLIGTITTGIAAGTAGVTTLQVAGGVSKAIPDDAVLIAVAASGAVDTAESFTVNGALASGATAVVVDSQTVNKARVNGDQLYLLGFAAFLALFTDAVTPASHTLGTEYAATGYARQPIPFGSGPTVADPPVAANSAQMTFGPFTGTVPSSGSGVVKFGGLFDSSSGGTADNMYGFFTWGASKTPGVNDSLQIAIGALSVAGS